MQRRFRLRGHGDFDRLRREGQVYHHRLLTVSLAANGLTHNRYGFITGKRLGNAVTRNRARRLLRETVRHLQPDIQTGFDIALIARQAMVGQRFGAVMEAARSLLSLAGVLKSGTDIAPTEHADISMPTDTHD